MSILLGELKTKFWNGKKYVFERMAKGQWICVYQGSKVVPHEILENLGD